MGTWLGIRTPFVLWGPAALVPNRRGRMLVLDRTLLISALLAVAACGDKDDPGLDTDGSRPDEETGEGADSGDSEPPDTEPPTPCADGGWGAITTWETAVHVSIDGASEGDGSWAAPLSSLDDALALLRERESDKHLALWPGSYRANLSLSASEGDDGTVVQGCSAAEVELEAQTVSAAVLEVEAATGVVLEGISTRGGTRGVQIWSGSEATLIDLRIQDATEVGVIVHGNSVQASLEGVEVHGAVHLSHPMAYGLAFQEGATVTMVGGGAFTSSSVGMLVDDVAELSLSGVSVEGTEQDSSGAYGRGLQIQSDSGLVSVRESSFSDNQGAGVFAMEVFSLVLEDNTISSTAASSLPGGHGSTGDGVVFTRGDSGRDPAIFRGSFGSNIIRDSARAGMLLDGVTAQVDDTTLSGNGGGDILAQGPANVSGGDPVTTLGEADALGLNLQPMITVDPGS